MLLLMKNKVVHFKYSNIFYIHIHVKEMLEARRQWEMAQYGKKLKYEE
jgi:hypothetical protein